MAGWFDLVLDMILPPRCVSCRADGDWWCKSCAIQVHPEVISESAAGLDGVMAAAYYQSPLNHGLRALKYRHAKAVAPSLAQYLLEPLRSIPTADLVLIPVPLHRARLKQRGHNQAELLTRALASQADLPVLDQLVRIRQTVSQTTLDKPHRAANVSGAFTWQGPPLTGKTVVVIDDVTTTGATLSACAVALRKAGPRQVWGLAVAKKR